MYNINRRSDVVKNLRPSHQHDWGQYWLCLVNCFHGSGVVLQPNPFNMPPPVAAGDLVVVLLAGVKYPGTVRSVNLDGGTFHCEYMAWGLGGKRTVDALPITAIYSRSTWARVRVSLNLPQRTLPLQRRT